jgi:LacI family transcriptional regulator
MKSKGKKADMSQRSATMADVARLAGVGKMTVSRVLTGSAKVSKVTAERVYRAIKILHYQPNEVARSLRAVNSNTIGVIVPYLYDPFFATCAHAISTVAKQHGYSVILTTSDESPDIEQKQTSLMLRRQVDGLVIIPVSDSDRYYSGEAFSRVHVVTLDRPAPGSRFDSVLVPNRAGAKTAVSHLIGHGHQSIAFLGLSRKLYTMKARYAGYREAMLDGGRSPQPYLDCESAERTEALILSMLNSKKPPTALFAANNLTMRYVLHALTAAGVHIPRQIAIAGFDDLEMADVLQPSLTVVRQPVYQLGEVAANLLFQRISGSEVPKASHRVVLPLELVIRSSCGCQPPAAKKSMVQNPTLTAPADEVRDPPAPNDESSTRK